MVLGNTLNILRPPDRSTPPIQTGWNEDLVKNLHNVLGEMSQQLTTTTTVATASLTHYSTKAILEAATVPLVVESIQLSGHTAVGDGGGALYKRVGAAPSHEFKIQSADDAWWEGVVDNGRVNPRALGGTSDEVSAEMAFDYVISEGPNRHIVVFSGTWTILNTVTISDPQDVHVDARSAKFNTPNDILMFDLNGRADPTYQDNESRQNFHWLGGRFQCTFNNPTKATCFRMMGFRNASLQPEHFDDFYNDIILGDKDTVYIGGYMSQGARNTSIEIPPWSRLGGPLEFVFEKIHISPGPNHGKFINSYGALIDCVIRDFSCNLGTDGNQQGAIDIHSDVTLGLELQSGTFIAGELVTAASGAACTFVELYTHDFPFDVTQHMTWLVGENKNGTSFIKGDTLTAPSLATATVGTGGALNPNAYINQDSGWQNLKIGGVVHFEAGSSADGIIGIRLRDRINQGVGDSVFYVDAGNCGLNGRGSVGVELQNIGRVVITGRFNQTSSSITGTDISFTAPDLIDSAGSGFGSFIVDDKIEVSGTSTNDGVYKVAAASSSQLELVEQTITTEGSGASMTIRKFSTPIKLNSGCRNITIASPTKFSTGVIDLNGMSRNELNMNDHNVIFPQGATITDWGPKTLSTVAATIIDMSVKFGNFEAIGGMAPKVYEISMQVRDAGSAANSSKFSIHHPNNTTAIQFHLVDVTGVANDQYVGAQFSVGADSNGDIEYETTTSADNAMDVAFVVRRMLY